MIGPHVYTQHEYIRIYRRREEGVGIRSGEISRTLAQWPPLSRLARVSERETTGRVTGRRAFFTILRNFLALEMPHSRRFVSVTMAARARSRERRTFDSGARNPTPLRRNA